MKGNEILTEVKILINDMIYSRYNEINAAYREIGRLARHNWLRGESEEKIEFLDGQATYWIDLDGIRVFRRLYVLGNDSSQAYYHLMEETDSQTFEDMRVQHLQPDGTNREGRPAYYKILESSDQRIKIQVTPVPDDTYTGRIEYIKSLEEIGPVTTPSMPKDYHDLISVLAAGKILQRSDDPKERARGQQLIAEARRDAVLGLVKDAHANRTKDITRPRRSVNEFI